MAAISTSRTLLIWGRVVKKLAGPGHVLVASPWNGINTADPDNLIGGISFQVPPHRNDAYILTAKGTGDAGGYLNTGAGAPGDAFGFAGVPPSTYTQGWPNAFGGFDTIDPASALGSAAGHISGNQVQFPTTPGACTTTTAWANGRFYVEMKVTNQDLFSGGLGIGVMRPGFDLTYIFANAEYSVSDPNGGAMLDGGNLGTTPPYQLTASTNGSNTGFGLTPDATNANDTWLSFAVAMLTRDNFIPQPFSAVPLPRLICCPVTRMRAMAQLRK